MDRVYTAEATASGARTGEVSSSDGRLTASLSRPAEMGGDDGPGTNPEQLFAAGYSACFHSAMRFALKPLGLSPAALEGSSVTAQVHFLRGEAGDDEPDEDAPAQTWMLATAHPSAVLRVPDEDRPKAYDALVADLRVVAGALA